MTAAMLQQLTTEQLRREINRHPHDSADALDIETEIKSRAPRTETVCRVFGIPFLTTRQMDALGRALVALPRKEG